MLRYLIIGLVLTPCGAQTKLSSDQVTLPDLVTQEERWCPGPIMRVSEDRKSFTVGLNWSTAKPCYMHFNLTPPTKVDPVSITSFVESFTVAIPSAFLGDDDVYLFAVAPTFTPAVANAKIGIRVKSTAAVTCGGCGAGVVADRGVPRMFPASTVPIGFAAIRGGKFLPKPDELLARQQIFIGPGAEMSVTPDQGGYVFQVNPATATALRVTEAAAALKATQAITAARSALYAPPPTKEVADLRAQVTEMAGQLSSLDERTPKDPEVVSLFIREQGMAAQHAQDAASQVIEQARMNADEQVGRIMYNAQMRVEVPMSSAADCTVHQWAQDDRYLYRCIPALQLQAPPSWVRYAYDRKWGR